MHPKQAIALAARQAERGGIIVIFEAVVLFVRIGVCDDEMLVRVGRQLLGPLYVPRLVAWGDKNVDRGKIQSPGTPTGKELCWIFRLAARRNDVNAVPAKVRLNLGERRLSCYVE